ncbi:alpha/beta hydrolase [Mucilaginibacter sp. KACC 22773]|uniref:alpha/beta hydrolase n=1 Tax=Mucilaginibacter sp. KACC 22773 TaxID=3025671 RepID=UPI002365D16E|nr:alpha/beta hydrolase [Mucilaginibacter sp. KACC 22773]WDF81128.1 alpha/beta hydrolase [Mucilaginibacter sp. KACC 22773]
MRCLIFETIATVSLLTCSMMAFGQDNKSQPIAIRDAPKLPDYIEKPADASGIFAIYGSNGVPPGSEKWALHEQTSHTPGDKMVRNVVIPTVTVFRPEEGTANGTALVIAPGGAFHVLMMDNEGYTMARWATKLGMTAFVLKYRVQHTPADDAEWQKFAAKTFSELPKVSMGEIYPPMSHPGAEEARLWGEEDARQAIRFIRQHAKDFSIDPHKIGTMGFSAGGGISVNAGLRSDSLSRPDFIGAIYAGYRIVSPVPQNVPPLFIAIANDDKSVAPISSARLFEDWHKLGQSVELHIFSSGSHGFGTKHQNKLSDQWMDLFKNWLSYQGFLSGAINK